MFQQVNKKKKKNSTLVFDNFQANIVTSNKNITLGLWDTAGQEDYDRLRPLSYPGTDVFLICCSVSNKSSISNVFSKWIPEIQHHCPNTPILIVVTKCDLWDSDEDNKTMKREEIIKMFQKSNLSVVFTSAKQCLGLKECFSTALDLAQNKKSKKGKIQEFIVPPVLPEAGKAPWIFPETNCFELDMKKLLNLKENSDVEFIFEHDEDVIYAHHLILSSNETFKDIFDHPMKEFEGIDWIKEIDGKIKIKMHKNVKKEDFLLVLEFIYTGICQISDKEIDEIEHLSKIFSLDLLGSICSNIKMGDPDLNPSIGNQNR